MAGNEFIIFRNMFLFLYQNLPKTCHMGYQSSCYDILRQSAQEWSSYHWICKSVQNPYSMRFFSTSDKARLTGLNQLFPGLPFKTMLKIRNVLKASICKYFPEDGVVSDSQRPPFISVCHMHNFKSVRKNWDAMSID